jgi:hypothetical protein
MIPNKVAARTRWRSGPVPPEVLMPKPIVDFPIFDADNHMYETTDAFTKFLPLQYSGLF